ncbi:hypothetical protein [Fusibacillus kribbianus]|nr:hypothetical protein [Ruminococcus sp. YH-rum2234]
MMKKEYVLSILSIIAVVFAVGFGMYLDYSHRQEVENAYAEAGNLIDQEYYEAAIDALSVIEHENYEDTHELMEYCRAHISYDSGNLEAAYENLKYGMYENQPVERKQKMAAFKNRVETEYDAYCEAERTREREEEEKAYQQKVRSGVPFVGMRESDISNTIIGSPSPKTRGNHEFINGKQYKATLYDFMKDGRVIFTARCIRGKVTEVWDKRDNPHEPYGSIGSKSSSKPGKLDSYDDGYEDIYENGDYDWDRYQTDFDYADGVDEAIEDDEY